MSEKRVKCPACESVAFVKKNRVGDPYLSCGQCGAWNGRGAKYRNWCESLPELPEPGQKSEVKKPEPVVPDGDGHKQSDWLEAWQ